MLLDQVGLQWVLLCVAEVVMEKLLELVVLLVGIHRELVELLEKHLERVVQLVGMHRELAELLEMHQ
jgi:hypothetical protein